MRNGLVFLDIALGNYELYFYECNKQLAPGKENKQWICYAYLCKEATTPPAVMCTDTPPAASCGQLPGALTMLSSAASCRDTNVIRVELCGFLLPHFGHFHLVRSCKSGHEQWGGGVLDF